MPSEDAPARRSVAPRAQPLAEQQMRACKITTLLATTQPIHRFAVEALSDVTVADQGA